MSSPKSHPLEIHDHETLYFPKDFLWGSSTSAHQVEGGNIYNDWWEWEQKHQPSEMQSKDACDQYNRFEEDFKLAKNFSQNSHRLSIEWSRIEPEEGKFNYIALEHYIKVLKTLKSLDFTVMLTLFHFTLPLWVAKKGGWANSNTQKYFENFVKFLSPHIKDYVDFWITVNEPGVYAFMAYTVGEWPPQVKSKFETGKVFWNSAQAHNKVYKVLKSIAPKTPVGIAHNIQSFAPYHKHSLKEQMYVFFSDIIANHSFYFLTRKTQDFVGVNYYFHHRFKEDSKLLLSNLKKYTLDDTHDVSDLGWEVYPEGMFDILTDLADHKPIYITECGIASTNDDRRTRFLIHYLQEVYRAISSGVDVRGFFYWSLIDNFEWSKGFNPRFGLIEVDYKSQKRIPRQSADVYSEIIRTNGIPHKLLKLLGHTVKVSDVLCNLHSKPKSNCEHLTSARHLKHTKPIHFSLAKHHPPL